VYDLEIDPKLFKKVKRWGHQGLNKKLQNILKNPKVYGEPLRENLAGFYKARTDPYRILYEIDEPANIVRVIEIGTRDDIYEHFNP
jgi:mRNA interferase RelE/StbE